MEGMEGMEGSAILSNSLRTNFAISLLQFTITHDKFYALHLVRAVFLKNLDRRLN